MVRSLILDSPKLNDHAETWNKSIEPVRLPKERNQ
jgi:hypothetical protein